MNFEKALRFPVTEQNGLVKVIIGAVISLIPIVNFISMGYLIKLMGNIIKGEESMPEWTDIGDKFVQGIMAAIITFIYMLIPFIIMMAGGGLGTMARGGMAALFTSFLLAFIVAIIIGFFLPMALANFVGKGNFGAAFDFSTIIDYLKRAFNNYFIAYIVIIGLYIVLGIIAIIPLIGWIIGILGGFYISCVAAFLFGSIYRDVSRSQSR